MPDAKGLLHEGEIIAINGREWRVTAVSTTNAGNVLIAGGRAYAIELHARPRMRDPFILPQPRHRNDRAYLKRKKGRG